METKKQDIRSSRDPNIWNDAMTLVRDIYDETKTFPNSEIYGLTSQIRRSAVSVPSNIAEGHVRRHTAEFKHVLFIALGALAELETQVIIANEPGYINLAARDSIVQRMNVLGKQIRSLVSKLIPNPQSQASNK